MPHKENYAIFDDVISGRFFCFMKNIISYFVFRLFWSQKDCCQEPKQRYKENDVFSDDQSQ
jgi:hypothetical protein